MPDGLAADDATAATRKFTVDTAGAKPASRSVQDRFRRRAATSSWSQDVRVKPNTRYRLSAWVKTKGVDGAGDGGAVQRPPAPEAGAAQAAQAATTTGRSSPASSPPATRSNVTINMLFGGWGRATGEAWYDDVQLIELGPAVARRRSRRHRRRRAGKLAQIVKIVTRHYADRAPADSIVATLDALKGAEPRAGRERARRARRRLARSRR